jgi:hypothetical protein
MSIVDEYLKSNIRKLLDDNTYISYPLVYTQSMIEEQKIPIELANAPYYNSNPYYNKPYITATYETPFNSYDTYDTSFVHVGTSVDEPFKKKIIIGSYPNLNINPVVIKSVVKYYYLKIVDKWIYENLKPLLNYIVLVNGKSKLIEHMSQYDENTVKHDSMDDIDEKIIYLEDIILNKKMVKHVLQKLIDTNGDIEWTNLKNYESKIKHVFYNYIKKKFIDAIEK